MGLHGLITWFYLGLCVLIVDMDYKCSLSMSDDNHSLQNRMPFRFVQIKQVSTSFGVLVGRLQRHRPQQAREQGVLHCALCAN